MWPTMSGLAKLQMTTSCWLRGDAGDERVGDTRGAHLRLEIVGRDLGRGHQHAALADERLLAPAVEEIGDVRVLLGLGEPQIAQTVRGQDLGDVAGCRFRGEDRPGTSKSCAYSVIVVDSIDGQVPRSNPVKVVEFIAGTSWRMRSARKLKYTTESPLATAPTGVAVVVRRSLAAR